MGPVLGSRPRYRPAKLFSEDRLGTLWRGTDAWSGAPVLVRLLDERLTLDPRALDRATKQLRAVQMRVSNPHVAKVLDYDLSRRRDQPAFVVFEGTGGKTLARGLERWTALPVERALRLVAGVADGLAATHAARVYHSALTSASVIVDDDVVRVIDFALGELVSGHRERGRNGSATNLRDRGPADVLAVGLLFQHLLLCTQERPARRESDALLASESRVLRDAGTSLCRARSPYWLQRPNMAELAEALAPALIAAPVSKPGFVLRPEPVSNDPGAVAPTASILTAPPKRSGRIERRAPTRPAAVVARRAPAVESVPARSGRAVRRVARTGELRFADGVRSSAGSLSRWSRRVPAVSLALAFVAVVAMVSIGFVVSRPSSDHQRIVESGQPPSAATTVPPSTSSTGVMVPDVLGLSAMEAGRILARAGFLLADAEPAPGPPGTVVDTDPAGSQLVEPGTPITLFVGAPLERLELES